MMRLTGFSVTRVTSVQKSSPAALPSEYFDRYDATPLRNGSGPTYASIMPNTPPVFS